MKFIFRKYMVAPARAHLLFRRSIATIRMLQLKQQQNEKSKLYFIRIPQFEVLKKYSRFAVDLKTSP